MAAGQRSELERDSVSINERKSTSYRVVILGQLSLWGLQGGKYSRKFTHHSANHSHGRLYGAEQ